jgi:diguanylate cyclase (GGDEF)-like protein
MSSPSAAAQESRLGVLSWRAARLIAAVAAAASGVTVIVMALGTPGLEHPLVPIATGATTVAMGVAVVPFLPWQHWPYRCVVGVVLAGFTLNAIDRSFAPTAGTFGATVMTMFIAIGFVSTRRQMTFLTVPMLVAIILPFVANPDSGVSLGGVLFIAGGCIIWGQCTAYLSERLLQSEKLAVQRLAVLEDVVDSGLVLSGSEEFGVSNTVVTIARRLLGVDRVALLVRADDELAFASQSGWPAFPTNTRIRLSDVANVAGAIPIKSPDGLAALLIVPDGAPVGLDADLVSTLVSQIGTAISREASFANLRDAALHDPLTGVGNRRRADALFASLHTGDAIVTFDIDRFKDLNDRLGHGAGDSALRDFSRLLGEEIRSTDHVARLGGDEFLIVLRGARQAEVVAAWDRLRRRWASRYGVTFSVGVAWCEPDEAPETTLAAADGALYRAKNCGRDRMELALSR